MTSRFQLSVNNARPIVAPGARVEVTVTVQNLSNRVDQVIVEVAGLEPDWVEVIPAQLPVFPQAQATARVLIDPPNQPAVSRAGLYPIRLRAISRETRGLERDLPATLDLRLVGACRLVLDQPERSDARQASYQVRVENGANAPAHLSLSASDRDDALWYAFEPFDLEVPAGGTANATLLVQPRVPAALERRHTFSLAGHGSFRLRSGGEAPAVVPAAVGRFVQLPAPRLQMEVVPPTTADGEAATYRVRLNNPGLAPVTAALTLDGDLQGLEWTFEPARVSLPPQSRREAMLRLNDPEPVPAGEQRRRNLRVTAVPEERDTEPVAAEAEYTQLGPPRPVVVPERHDNRFLWWLVPVVTVLILILILVMMAQGGR